MLPSVHSDDDLESLKALPPEDLYARLALWMVDASQEDIAAFWQHYKTVDNRANEINDLIFINWSRIDPQAAVDAAKGTPDEHYTWWAWACHDPAGSLAAVMAQNPGRLNNVTWGLGEFHPDWVREHWDEIPSEGQNNALQGMAKWDDVGNPLDILTFLQDKGYGFHPGIFKVLIGKDPWAAYEWIQESGGKVSTPWGGSQDTLGSFVNLVAEQHPEMLEKLAAQTPSGELKWKMEAALFANLLKTDPEAAKEQALANTAPKVAIDQLSAVGISLLSSDPDQAFAMAERIFSLDPDALSGMTTIHYGGGGSGWGSGAPEANRLIASLVSRDPARTLEMVMGTDPSSGHRSSFQQVANIWAQQDLDGYADWVGRQDDPSTHTQGVNVMVSRLTESGRFDDAVEWAMSLKESENRYNYLPNLIHQWGRSDRQAAVEWLENSGLPEDQITRLQSSLPAQP
ncbi:hypothetical protein [Luteolibacter marinus]|uniref:hypothetical protein n=1 Tax=Luteolibacter marinus TaxID=2776705 RepID=UPI0018662693|nr:hypothetical protein [Luteolibacter marinus]